VRRSIPFVILVTFAGCGGGSTPAPTTPTTPTTPTALAAPVASAPGADQQLTSLRPTLTVVNSTTTGGSGARTYDFQVSDRSDFSAGTGTQSPYYTLTLTQNGVAEGTGSTSVTITSDLVPAARFYWRARVNQGSLTSDWSAVRSFRTQIVAYTRPGELYDPLVNGQTIAELLFKRTTFIAGKGLRINDSDSYARFRLNPPIAGGGEFSVDIEGLTDRPVSENSDTAKLKIFSMGDTLFSIYFSKWLMDTQYRGFNGNPDNAIAYKVLFGQDEDDHKLEPDLNVRRASVLHLNPANTYHWKATFGMGFHLRIFDGGAGAATGIGGAQIYDFGQTIGIMYAPSPMFAYLGINESGAETGSFPNAVYRNLWIGDKARPRALGTALLPAPALTVTRK
jgi:hypothetical protein